MANTIICGFETRDTAECAATTGTVSVQNTTARNGGYALRVNPTTSGTGRADIYAHDATGAVAIDAMSAATAYYQFYFRANTLPDTLKEICAQFVAIDNITKANLFINSAGNLLLHNESNTLIATGTTALSTGVWYRIGVKIGTGSGAVSAYEVQIDGVSEFSGTTASLYEENNGVIRLGKVLNTNSKTVDFYYDDLIVSNSGFPDAGQCDLLIPNANGTYSDWTIGAGAGSNYENVDEFPNDGDTTYLLSTVMGIPNHPDETEQLAAMAAALAVAAVKPFIVVKRDGAVNGSTQLMHRSGSTDTTLSAGATTSAYALKAAVLDVDPATSVAWTAGGVNAFEVGAKSDGGISQTRMTQVGAMVYYAAATGHPAARRLGGVEGVRPVNIGSRGRGLVL